MSDTSNGTHNRNLINHMIDRLGRQLDIARRLAPGGDVMKAFGQLLDLVDELFRAQDQFSKASSKYSESTDDIELAMLRDAHMKMTDAFRNLRMAVRS